jgi:hypothetical protein
MATGEATKQKDEEARDAVIYVYGIVPADVEADPEARGVGDPPGRVSVVRHGDIAALVSEIAADRPLGKPEDLTAHAQLLDAAAAETPVLPIRFGAAVSTQDAVAEELLAEHHDEFAAALHELEGRAQYVVKGRYVQQAILSEILEESQEAAQLREQIRDQPEDATRNERIALGELVNNAIAAKRETDTARMVEMLEPLAATLNVREPTHEEDAVQVACLLETAKQKELEEAVGSAAQEWEGRVELRVLGPLAPYDFVTTAQG